MYFVSTSYRYIRCDEIVLLPISLDCRQGLRENFMKGQGVRVHIKVKNHWLSVRVVLGSTLAFAALMAVVWLCVILLMGPV